MSKENEKEQETPKSSDMISETLFKKRTLMICEEVSQKMARRVCLELLALSAESDEDITLFINSQGGHVEAGDSIHDMIRFIKPKVIVIGTGWVASAGTHIYLAADKADRFCLPNTRFLIHQPSGGVGGQASDIAIQAEEIIKMRERLALIIAEQTGQSVENVREDIERDNWMTAKEAIAYGICGKQITSVSELG